MKNYLAITGRLIARTAIHIGSGEGSNITDALCRRDAAGHFLIPGAAIGGVLRAVTTRLAPRIGANVCKALLPNEENVQDMTKRYNDRKPCECAVCHLFGELNPSEDEGKGRASRLFVAHAKAVDPQISSRIRDGVGIDRASKTSARAAQAKFDLEVLPPNTLFKLRLELEDATEEDQNLLAATLAEWEAGRLWLGGRVARGLGAFKLEDLQVVQQDLTSDAGLLAFLKDDAPWTSPSVNTAWITSHLDKARERVQGGTTCHDGVARSFVTLCFALRFESLFLTNDTVAATRSGFDHAPLLEVMTDQQSAAILPGAGLRGVLRSQAERIARTLTTLETNNATEFGARCPACDPLRRPDQIEEQAARLSLPANATELDKLKARASLNVPLASCDALLKGYLKTIKETKETQLCLGCLLFGSTRRGSRLTVEDAFSEKDLPRKVLDFLAIDRFTGGGKEGAKFDAIGLWKPAFRVRLHLENPSVWELGWLMLTLRDIADGLVPVGFGAAKGFGQPRIDSLKLDYGFISDDDYAGASEIARSKITPTSGLYRVLGWDTQDASQRAQLLTIAEDWVKKFNDKLMDFKREDSLLRVQRDTYFDGEIPQLYEKEATQWLLKK